MKKILKRLILCLIIIPCMVLFSACGKDGLSAYELWKQHNPTSTLTEEEWLKSLVGEKGESGTNGTDGSDGADSISSYNVWKEAFDNEETDLDYVSWLKANFDIVIDAEKYAVNENLLKVLEISCYTNLTDLNFNAQPASSGSGVIFKIDDDGSVYVVTNYHVAYKSNYANNAYPYFKLKFYEQDNFHFMKGAFIGGSSTYDIAVLKVEASSFISNTNTSAVTISSESLAAGTPVIAIGNARGEGINISRGSVDKPSDLVSITVAGHICDHRVIIHDAYIINGNSGGGLFDLNGNLVGITNAGKTNDTDNQTKYAIPADVVKRIANQLIENHKADATSIELKTIDLKISNLTYDKFTSYNGATGLVDISHKVKITAVSSESIFASDLAVNDIYVSMSINGNKTMIDKDYLLSEILLDLRVGDTLKIEVKREVETGVYDTLEFSKQISAGDFIEIK